MQKGEQEALDLVVSQSADGRHGAAAHGGATSLQLEQHKHSNSWYGKKKADSAKQNLLYLVTYVFF